MSPISYRGLAAIAVAAATALGAGGAIAQTAVKFTLDWKFQGPVAPFLLAQEKGYFAEEGIEITMDSGNGSAGAVTRVAGGAYDMGFADINAMINFRVQNPEQAVKAVMVIYDAPPFSLFTIAGRGIDAPADLVGRSLGAPVFDASYQLFPAFAHEVGIASDVVERINMDPPLREVMLVRGDVDVISGHYFTSLLNLKAQGVPEDDIKVFLYRDFGMDFYGNVIIASGPFLAEHPDAVRGVLKAIVRGFKDTIADPEASLSAVANRDPLIDQALELERLQLATKVNVLTPTVVESGMGDVDLARLENSIEQLSIAYGFDAAPAIEDIWTDEFLPPQEDRMVAP